MVATAESFVGGLRNARVLIVGLGNIGSFLAVLLAPLVSFVRLVDRDVIENHNAWNQCYAPHQEGKTKVDAMGDWIRQLAPHVQIEHRVADLKDLPWGDFADVDVALAGLDSLRARQMLAEKLQPLRIPYIDGAVGEPLLTRIQVLLPERACLECQWGEAHYRQLATEYPCHPHRTTPSPRTTVAGCVGAATAALMVAQCTRLFSPEPPRESYEINGDLLTGRFRLATRRRNARCRFPHHDVGHSVRLSVPFHEATVADLLATLQREFNAPVQLEFPRGWRPSGLFASDRLASDEQLRAARHLRLADLHVRSADRIVVRSRGVGTMAFVCFDRSSEVPV